MTTAAIASSQPYIGSKVSLITNSKVRYEGTLYTIDTTKSTIYLSSVRILGTEGRQTSRPVPGREETFDYIVFKAGDIKEMVACEPGKKSEMFVDPAIVSCSGSGIGGVPDLSPRAMNRSPVSSPNSLSGQFRELIRQGGVRSRDSNGVKDQTTPRSTRPVRTFVRQRPTLPTVYIGMNKVNEQHTGVTPQPAPKDRLTFDKDYDIQEANEKFQHEALSPKDTNSGMGPTAADNKKPKERNQNGEEGHGEEAKKGEEPYYNKSVSFFDHISCDKPEGGTNRPEWKRGTQRQFNEETFGPSERPFNSRRGGRNNNRFYDDSAQLVNRPPPPIGMAFMNGGAFGGAYPYGLGAGAPFIYGMNPFFAGGAYSPYGLGRNMLVGGMPSAYQMRTPDRRSAASRNRQ